MGKTKARAPELRPPSHLSADAARIWREVVAHLRTNGQLLRIDSWIIESFVTAVIRQRRLTAVLDKAALVDKDGKPHPLLRTIEATATTIKNLSHVLGLNPMARKALPARIKQPRLNGLNGGSSKAGADPWHGVLEE